MRQAFGRHGYLLLAFAAVGCSCDEDRGSDSTATSCRTTSDCNEMAASTGWVCVSGKCQACATDQDCAASGYYGEESECVLPLRRCSQGAAGAAGAGSGNTPAGGDSSTGDAGQTSVVSDAGAGQGGGEHVSVGGAGAVGGAAGNGVAPEGNGGRAEPGGLGGTSDGGSFAASGAGGAAAGAAGDTSVESSGDCATGEAETLSGSCVACPNACDAEGESGAIYPNTTASGLCVCETDEGYYFGTEGGIGTYPCDADQDGWVRDSARYSLESEDQAVRANARCALHRAESIWLENEDGERYGFYFTEGSLDVTEDAALGLGALPLYESVRNDEQATLNGSARVPRYGGAAGARSLRAEELNSLTKACVGKDADHNDNGVADVSEWGKLPDAQVDLEPQGAGRDDFRALYAQFSYFVELHEARFVATSVAADGLTELGQYVIRERKRAMAALGGFPLRYGAEPGSGLVTSDFWQFCPRARDRGYADDAPAPTYDFASISGPSQSKAMAGQGQTWSGMMHHSQFKCVQVVSEEAYDDADPSPSPSPGGATNAALHMQTPSSLAERGWQVNECAVSAEPISSSTPPNPAQSPVSCTPISDGSPLEVGALRWAAVRIAEIERYERGCIKQCEGALFICPGSASLADPGGGCFALCGDISASLPLWLGGSGTGEYSMRGEVSAQALGWGYNADSPVGNPYVLGHPGAGYSITVLGAP